MTDRIHSLTVVLDVNYRADDIEPLIAAISLFAGVQSVAGNVAQPGDYVAETRARFEMREKVMAVLYPKVSE